MILSINVPSDRGAFFLKTKKRANKAIRATTEATDAITGTKTFFLLLLHESERQRFGFP